MHRSLQFLCVCAALSPSLAGAEPACLRPALAHLRAAAPDGLAIYRAVGDPGFFQGMIRCDDAQFDLSTAVHESTHLVTSNQDAFPLVGGGSLALPHEVSGFYPPMRIADRFKSDDFTTIYLRLGQASSATDFLYLLDELNAYAHDLKTAVDLRSLADPERAVDHRDGLAALMAFVAVYAEQAKASEPTTWHGLRQPKVAAAVATLWDQAERVLASSCGIPDFGTEDKVYIQRFCAAPAREALTPLLGRPPLCPIACLEPAANAAAAAEEARPRAGVPAWFASVMRAKAALSPSDPVEGELDGER